MASIKKKISQKHAILVLEALRVPDWIFTWWRVGNELNFFNYPANESWIWELDMDCKYQVCTQKNMAGTLPTSILLAYVCVYNDPAEVGLFHGLQLATVGPQGPRGKEK